MNNKLKFYWLVVIWLIVLFAVPMIPHRVFVRDSFGGEGLPEVNIGYSYETRSSLAVWAFHELAGHNVATEPPPLKGWGAQ